MSLTRHTNESIESRTFPVKTGTAALIIFSTITTVASVMGTYYNLKGDIRDVANKADMQQQINNVRLNQMEKQQLEDHEWNRTLSARITVLEERCGIKMSSKYTDDTHK